MRFLSNSKVEWSPECQQVLKARIKDGYLDHAPVFSDVEAYKPSQSVQDSCEGLVGGFPCQAPCSSMKVWIGTFFVWKYKSTRV